MRGDFLMQRLNIKLVGLFTLLLILLSGCGEISDTYEAKRDFVMMKGDSNPDVESEIDMLLYLAERDLKYHLSPDEVGTFAFEFSGSANFAYNLSYMLNTPAKLIHNIRYDILLTDHEYVEDEKIANTIVDFSRVLAIILDVIYAAVGFVFANIMLVIGSVTGLLFHPIQTITDLPTVIMGLIETVIEAVTNIFSW
jgi:hypothetical protein